MNAETAAAPRRRSRTEERREKARRAARNAAAACETLLGRKVTGYDLPGGLRQSIRVHCGDESVIVTRRPSLRRARLEVSALYALHAHGGAVPRVIAFDGIWLIQEDLGARRLSQALAGASAIEGEQWLDAAFRSLIANHDAATRAGLHRSVVVIGTNLRWFTQLLGMPVRLGRLLDLPAPKLPNEEIVKTLRVTDPCFIKWDARPGNAVAMADGSVAWFDWEHAGCRNRIDDLCWMLADDYMPDWPDAVERLLDAHLADFAAKGDDVETARRYFYTFATLHSCVRQSLILTSKKDGPWWDAQKILAGDKVGVTRQNCVTGLTRAARWAARSPLTEALAPWFEALVERLPEDLPRERDAPAPAKAAEKKTG